MGMDSEETSNMNIYVHGDNTECLFLANTEPPRMAPQSKHNCTKYHWLRDQLDPNHTNLYKLDNDKHLWDILTKGLQRNFFKKIRKLLMEC